MASPITLRPNGAGSNTNQIKAGGASTNYGAVSDDSDTTYCTTLTVNSYVLDTYAIATPSIPEGATIDSVRVKIRFVGTAGRSAYFKPCVYVGTTAYYGSEQNRTDATITEYTETWTVNPADSAAWEAADLVNLEVGDAIKHNFSNAGKVYEVYVYFYYTEASGTARCQVIII